MRGSPVIRHVVANSCDVDVRISHFFRPFVLSRGVFPIDGKVTGMVRGWTGGSSSVHRGRRFDSAACRLTAFATAPLPADSSRRPTGFFTLFKESQCRHLGAEMAAL